MRKNPKSTQILQMCSGCPQFLMRCPGITVGKKKVGIVCKKYAMVTIDGKPYGMEIERTGDLAPYIKEGKKIIINPK